MITPIFFKISLQSNRRYGAIIIHTKANDSSAGYRFCIIHGMVEIDPWFGSEPKLAL